jgi:RNA polymerase-binding protein DksA
VADVEERLRAERLAIEAQVASLTRTFDDVVESIEDVGNDDEHDPDGSTIAFERAQVIALLRQARENLAEVDEALARVAGGTYGRCETCGRVIPPERLEARPTTRTCVDCAR